MHLASPPPWQRTCVSLAMASVEHSIPAPRKDLSKVTKRKRSAPKPTADAATDTTADLGTDLDMDLILAALTDEARPQYYAPEKPTETRVNYCTYANNVQLKPREPRLLLRQAYKIATEAYAVVGLESKGDYDPSIYLVNDISSVRLTFEDLISLSSVSVVSAVEKLFKDSVGFQPFHLDKITVEVSATGGLYFYNYDVYNYKQISAESQAPRPPNGLYLQRIGWNAFKRLFECIENYYKLCAEVSTLVPHLVDRYSKYFTRRYKPKALLLTSNTSSMYPVPALSPDMKQLVTTELPLDLKTLCEYRLPVEPQSHWYSSSPLREALTPWVDAEVRRYCVVNIIDSVLESLKHAARWF